MMVQIHTLSVADFKHTMQNNDLYDSTIESMPELAVISIGNSFDDFDPDDIFSNGPSFPTALHQDGLPAGTGMS